MLIQGWGDMDSQLTGANYPVPYDHGSQEIGAYQRDPVPVDGQARDAP